VKRAIRGAGRPRVVRAPPPAWSPPRVGTRRHRRVATVARGRRRVAAAWPAAGRPATGRVRPWENHQCASGSSLFNSYRQWRWLAAHAQSAAGMVQLLVT